MDVSIHPNQVNGPRPVSSARNPAIAPAGTHQKNAQSSRAIHDSPRRTSERHANRRRQLATNAQSRNEPLYWSVRTSRIDGKSAITDDNVMQPHPAA